jgi:rare lipoprotein A
LRDQITDRRALRNALIVVAIAAVTGSVASDANAHSLSAQKQLRTAPAAKNAKKEIDGGRFDHKQRKIVRNKLSESTHWTSTVSRTIERDDGDGANSGIASIYSDTQTASGEAMSAGAMTAAHRTLPFGTRVTVTNRQNGRAVVVRINDRGPFVRGRIIDLSPAAAQALRIDGLALVSLAVASQGEKPTDAASLREPGIDNIEAESVAPAQDAHPDADYVPAE